MIASPRRLLSATVLGPLGGRLRGLSAARECTVVPKMLQIVKPFPRAAIVKGLNRA
jgi:hypothetical protein